MPGAVAGTVSFWSAFVGHWRGVSLGEGLRALVPVRLDIPVCIDVSGFVFFNTCDFDLLETPLWEIDVAGAKITAKRRVLEPE